MLVSFGTRRKRNRSVSKSQMLWHESMRSITTLQSWDAPAPGLRDVPPGKGSGPSGVAPPCPGGFRGKPLDLTLGDHPSGFDRDRDGPVVYQFHVHVGGEPARGHPGPEGRQRGREPLDQRLRLLRPGGRDPRRSPALAGVAVERELADDEDLAADLADGHVHEPGFVV